MKGDEMTLRMSQASALLSLFLFTSFIFGAQAQSDARGTLQGQARDTVGATISSAHVIVHMDNIARMAQGVPGDVVPKVDTHGRFSLQLSAGFYDVCVMADAFTPVCEKVHVRPGKTATCDFRIKVDPDVAKLIADPVY